jgi:hypothetical protein
MKILIVASILSLFILSCSTSQEDNYNLVTQDRKYS